ncbi:putative tRNA nucleotidyltransferase poly(A) polymerase family protein [Lyophyllum shimeji]|uniref:tRNA nucleotidyltransferase poly(A) polymerase family protein n=1 Tax=Lyophyllum shimeji TaxID=47721 RepID=A0A9P3PJD2_LYOSH|nr:putative tRNA nucleotidyltransferase poly(A) polymerase family protein [Lyophyllum shimeji]
MSLRHATLRRIQIPQEMKVELTDEESEICKLLDDCTKYLKEEKRIETSCRIAGGWVRDKLLGSDSHDIDIALSDMMGLEFANHLAEFARNKGIKTGNISKIAQNPEQSKHLETATFRFLGLDIDLVNLRSEEYTDSSRIPTEVKFGTPVQDALRRDTTINALFYNVHSREVEDHTGKGLDDLREGIIRTPLTPTVTFLDDPLRVLRCVRFASRYGFDLVPELAQAAKDAAIQTALVTKVARERAGDELTKMMKGRDPFRAIQLISDLSLYDAIFSVIPQEIQATFSSPPAPRDTAFAAASILHALLHPNNSSRLPRLHSTYLAAVNADSSCRARLYLATTLTPYESVTYRDKKNKSASAIEYILRETLKLGTQHHFLDGIPALFSAANLLKNPVLTSERFPHPSQRVALGLLLREKAVHNANTGSDWATSLLFSLVQELVPLYDFANDTIDVEAATKIIETYNAFIAKVDELDLPRTVDAKPLLDGREVIAALGASKHGAWMGKVMSNMVQWQLENPEGTKEMCIAWLQDEQREGRIQTDDGRSEPASKRARTK